MFSFSADGVEFFLFSPHMLKRSVHKGENWFGFANDQIPPSVGIQSNSTALVILSTHTRTHTHTHTHIKCLGCPFPILKYLEINQTKSGNDWRCQKMVKGMYFCRLINSDSDMACVSSSPHGYC